MHLIIILLNEVLSPVQAPWVKIARVVATLTCTYTVVRFSLARTQLHSRIWLQRRKSSCRWECTMRKTVSPCEAGKWYTCEAGPDSTGFESDLWEKTRGGWNCSSLNSEISGFSRCAYRLCILADRFSSSDRIRTKRSLGELYAVTGRKCTSNLWKHKVLFDSEMRSFCYVSVHLPTSSFTRASEPSLTRPFKEYCRKKVW